MRISRTAAATLVLASLLATTTAACGGKKDPAASGSGGAPGAGTTAGGGPTWAQQGEPAPTADTMEGLEMKGTLGFVVEGGSVCPVVTDGDRKRSLVLPSDWTYQASPEQVVDSGGAVVLKAGDDVSKVSFSPAYPENQPAPCGGASEAVAVDGVSPKEG